MMLASDLLFYNSIVCLLFGIVCVFFFIGYKKLPVYIGFVSLFFSFYFVLLLWWKFDPTFIGFNYNSSALWVNQHWEFVLKDYPLISLDRDPLNTSEYRLEASSPSREAKMRRLNAARHYATWLVHAEWDCFIEYNEVVFVFFDTFYTTYMRVLQPLMLFFQDIHERLVNDIHTIYYFMYSYFYDLFEWWYQFHSPFILRLDRLLISVDLTSYTQRDYFTGATSKFFSWWYWNSDHIGLAYDGVSIFFIILTAFVMPIVLVGSIRLRGFLDSGPLTFFLLVSQLILLLAFSTINFFYFFVAFESVLLPLFVMVVAWGSRDRKIKSAFYFLVYTIVTSIGFLCVILILGYEVGSTNLLDLLYFYKEGLCLTSDINNIANTNLFVLPLNKQLICWLMLFLTLANKLPMFPLYLWLPEAHVEAPTFGSIILAAVLLKLGSYGFFRFLVYAFPQASYYFSPLVFSLAILSIVFCSLTAIRCLDLKKIIAYSSIAHMNFAILGLFSNTLYGMHGALLLFLGHGLVSSALFFLVGVLYDTYGTRSLYYFSGLSQLSPVFSIAFFFFTLANISFPGTINFNAEILVLISIFFISPFTYFFLLIANVLSIIYAVWTFTRLCFGRLQCCFRYKFIRDLQSRELYSLLYLFVYVFLFGLFPCSLLDSMYWNLLKSIL